MSKLPRAPLGRKEISHATKGQWHGRPAREEPVRERSKSVMAGTAMPRRLAGGERSEPPAPRQGLQEFPAPLPLPGRIRLLQYSGGSRSLTAPSRARDNLFLREP